MTSIPRNEAQVAKDRNTILSQDGKIKVGCMGQGHMEWTLKDRNLQS
jgi:hypothetical protein